MLTDYICDTESHSPNVLRCGAGSSSSLYITRTKAQPSKSSRRSLKTAGQWDRNSRLTTLLEFLSNNIGMFKCDVFAPGTLMR